MSTYELADLLAHADRRTLAAVVTHLAGDPRAVPDLRDRAQIEAKAMEVIPPYLRGEKQVTPPNDEVLQAAMDLAVGAEVPAEYRTMVREQTGSSVAAGLNVPVDRAAAITAGSCPSRGARLQGARGAHGHPAADVGGECGWR